MPQQYAHTQASRPRYLTYPAWGRQLPETSIKGMQWGLALQNSKAPTVPLVLYGCVVARKTPMRACSDSPVFNSSVSLCSCSLPDFQGWLLEKVLNIVINGKLFLCRQ
jgi:hypothetical protein